MFKQQEGSSNQAGNSNVEKPWRRLFFIAILLIALATLFSVAKDSGLFNSLPGEERKAIRWGLSLIWFCIGVWLIKHIRRIVMHVASKSSRSDVRVTMLISRVLSALGYVFVLLVTLHLLEIKIGSILVGGAVTGVIVGVGAQSTLSNLFAGLVLFSLRPFEIGQFISVKTYLFGGSEYSGTVLDVNWYHTVLMDGVQRRILPNSSIIISAITVSATPESKLFTIPLPYSTPFHDFENQLHKITDDKATLAVKEFFEHTYTVEVQLPAQFDLDLVREAIVTFRAQTAESH